MTAVAVPAVTQIPVLTRRAIARAGATIGTAMLVVAALLLLAITVAPRVFHYRTATMLTGSMAPGIEPGDVIVDTQQSAAEMRVGQIVTYHIPVQDRRVESHRIVWLARDAKGGISFRTKGDANAAPDPWTAHIASTATMWRVRTVVPFAGDVIRFLRRPAVSIVLTRIVPVLIVVMLLVGVWRRPSDDDDATHPTDRKRLG